MWVLSVFLKNKRMKTDQNEFQELSYLITGQVIQEQGRVKLVFNYSFICAGCIYWVFPTCQVLGQ